MITKDKILVKEAVYIKQVGSITVVGECEKGQIRTQIHKNCFSFNSLDNDEIDKQMEITAKLMIGKKITLEYDDEKQSKNND